MKKTILSTTLVIILTAGVSANTHASLASNATLLMGPQTGFCEFDLGIYPDACLVGVIPTGNYIEYFVITAAGENLGTERIGLEPGTDGGITLGTAQTVGEIDKPWISFGVNTYHTSATAVTISSDDGAGNVMLDMTGWTLFWNNLEHPIQGADAIVTCGNDCSNGDSFTLDYNGVITGDPTFFGPTYRLHLAGTVSSVPVPAAAWLFGSGLLSLIGITRKKGHV